MSQVTVSLPFNLPSEVILALVVLGSFQAFKVLKTFFNALLFVFHSAPNVKKFGEWAVVTGSTDGIGLAYAKDLAKKGLNIVLVSRNEEKLAQCSAEIKQASPNVQVKTVKADLSSTDPEMYKRIETELSGLNIGILINNAGMSYPHAQYLDKLDNKLVEDLININVVALTKLTKIVLPGMVAKSKGLIINVGSAAGIIPVGDPLYSVYSGTKAYVDFFSKSLSLEYKSKGIQVENQVPYFVTSKLSKIRNASLFTPNPKSYAAAALGKIGYSASTVPYWAHAIQHFVLTSVPTFIAANIVLSHHIGVYKKAMKKQQSTKSD